MGELTAKQIEADIKSLEAIIKPYQESLGLLRLQHMNAVSREWVERNGITTDQVQLRDGDGVPWFGDAYSFGKWMRHTDCKKKWAEWNGCIYDSAMLMAGTMTREAPGMIEHVPDPGVVGGSI